MSRAAPAAGELEDLESYIPSLRQVLGPGEFEGLARACDRGQWSKALAGVAQNVARSIPAQRLGRLRAPLQLQGQLAGAVLRKWLDKLQRECSRQSYDRGCGTYADERDAVARYLVHKFTLEGFKAYAEVNLAPAMAMRGVEGP